MTWPSFEYTFVMILGLYSCNEFRGGRPCEKKRYTMNGSATMVKTQIMEIKIICFNLFVVFFIIIDCIY